MKQKQFITLCLLVAAAVFISSCQMGSANQNITWPVYQNSNYGYAFNYPPDCTYGPLPEDCKGGPPEGKPSACWCFINTENPDRVLMQTYQSEEGRQLVLAEFQVVNLTATANNPPNTSTQIKDWLVKTFPEFEEIRFEDSKIDGVSAVSVVTPASEMAPAVKEIHFILNDQLFQIRMLNPEEEMNSQFYESILRSFHFE